MKIETEAIPFPMDVTYICHHTLANLQSESVIVLSTHFANYHDSPRAYSNMTLMEYHSIRISLTFWPPFGSKGAGLNFTVVSVQWRGRGGGGVVDG